MHNLQFKENSILPEINAGNIAGENPTSPTIINIYSAKAYVDINIIGMVIFLSKKVNNIANICIGKVYTIINK